MGFLMAELHAYVLMIERTLPFVKAPGAGLLLSSPYKRKNGTLSDRWRLFSSLV